MAGGKAFADDIDETVWAANLVGAWCGVRDVDALVPGMADIFVLFGGGVAGTLDTLAGAMRQGVAYRYAIVGGRGRATFGLERAMVGELATWDDAVCPRLDPAVASEAEMLAALLAQHHGLAADLLETRSTNCGNNIAFLLDLLDEQGSAPGIVVLCQDAVMQRRMGATWARQVRDREPHVRARVINWAAYQARIAWRDGALAWDEAPRGMWEPLYWLGMLVGEVDRLTDDENGYGPRGRDFVAHVDVPAEVREAAEELRAFCDGAIRTPDDRFAMP